MRRFVHCVSPHCVRGYDTSESRDVPSLYVRFYMTCDSPGIVSTPDNKSVIEPSSPLLFS